MTAELPEVCPACGATADDGCEADCAETGPIARASARVLNQSLADEDGIAAWVYDAPVLGLEDVALGRGTVVPATVYRLRNRSCSGVMGLLYPDGEFLPKRASTSGDEVDCVDMDGNRFVGTVMWDGAQPSPFHEEAIGFWDREETNPVFQEGSKGILLAGYSNNGELWNSIAIGRAMR